MARLKVKSRSRSTWVETPLHKGPVIPPRKPNKALRVQQLAPAPTLQPALDAAREMQRQIMLAMLVPPTMLGK